jgi:superfamily I DNA and/or RNA helicase/very-short-patch-repair endonuclease
LTATVAGLIGDRPWLEMNTKANQAGQDSVAAAPISPEFLAGSTEAGLEKIRTRLLDLTNRNRLLNFRHTTASSLRVVDIDLNVVFRRLLGGEKLAFLPVPEPDITDPELALEGTGNTETSLSKISAADYAKILGWRTSDDLGDHSSTAEDSEVLPVLHYLEELETLTRKIGSAAKTAIEESGTNMLYLILGFLEWYESDESQLPRYAPLLTVPVALDRSGGKGKGFECTIEYSGDDFTTNLSLVEKMRRDFALDIPSVEDEETPEEYFSGFSHILKQKKRWRIRRQSTLALLSFGKLLMYRDLDPKAWPGIAKHTLVKELFEGKKNETITRAEEYSIDDPELKSEVPPLILDADSSQHSALIHALRGQNLVIEGPPGTGKSQTITNLIAAAMAKGKTILFVAEKLAALEVVRRRLDETGLGLFCLELHSHKTKKHALLNDLAVRQKAQGSFREPRDLDQHLAVVEEKKQILTHYVGLMNKPIEPFQTTIFEILWARDRFYRELPFTRELVGQVPDVLTFTRTQYAQKEQFLSVYAQHLFGVLRVCSDLKEHPWAWVAKTLTFEEEERVIDLLATFLQTLQETEQQCQALRERVDISLEESIDGIGMARVLLAALPEAPSGQALNQHLLETCREVRGRAMLQDFARDIENASATLRVLDGSTARPQAMLQSEVTRNLADTFEVITALGLQKCTHSQLRDIFERGKAAETALSEAESSFSALQTLLGCQAPFDTHGVALLLNCLRLIDSAPLEVLRLRAASLETDGVSQIVRHAAEDAHALQERHEELSRRFDLSLATTMANPSQFAEHATTLEKAGILQVWFGRAYRQASRTHRRIILSRRKESRDTMARDFRALADYGHQRAQFEGHTLYRETLGPNFRGVDTEWDAIRVLVGWYEEVFTRLPEHDQHAEPLREILLKARTERLKALRGSLTSHAKHCAGLERLQATIPQVIEALLFDVPASHSVPELLKQLRATNAKLGEVVKALGLAGLHADIPLARIPDLLAAAESHGAAFARVSANDAARELLGIHFNGIETDVGPVKNTLDFAGCLAGNFPRKAADWILCDDYVARLEQLRTWLIQTVTCSETLLNLGREIGMLTASTTWAVDAKESLEVVRRKAERSLANRDELPRWVHFVRVRAESREAGLAKLTSLADSKAMEAGHLVPAFRFLFYNSFARGLFAEHPDLSQFNGLTQEQARKDFAQSDKKAIQLYRERAASIIDRRPVPYGNQSGPVGTWTDLALITHEINKQKRHIPIRQLVRRASAALQALKPCFMMGPLSVAQYLVPGELHFDLIVMDEASQLKPEDAVGAIARGGQIVIVGDPKQLPPTNFFQRVAFDSEEDGDGDSRAVVEEGESILDVASTLYQPVHRLRWHYRSRHHSLIAFSNREFYQGDLVIFPSAYHEDANLGVKYHPVVGGTFENSRNAREAAVVVEAVLEHMEKHPEESLGVVTLNFEQRELIEELLDQRLRTDPFVMAYQERMNVGPEPFFVKNLENVQGDERDVIFISVTYGPDARGNQYLRFGPINGANGHRRLNVLFTRAKKRVEVFSSLDPDKIQTSGSSPWGLRALKKYLTFARTGVLDSPDDQGEQPTNDFERSVGSVLKENGFDVVPQVGVAGFFIDLAVRHPAKLGTFLLGIECDGASYHSGRSARDRDRLRQEILVNLGWKIYRVWSTDWFRSRATEIKRLLKHIEDMLATDPDYLGERNKTQRAESLRQQLIDLRENEIRAAFPDSPPEKGLLRNVVLDEFVRKHPKTRDDWFRVISHELRANTDSKQVGQYLPRVLAIIRDAHE